MLPSGGHLHGRAIPPSVPASSPSWTFDLDILSWEHTDTLTKRLADRVEKQVTDLSDAAVAHIGGLAFTGFVAWLAWLGVHLIKLIGFRNRLFVLMNWAWDYFLFERMVRLILPATSCREV